MWKKPPQRQRGRDAVIGNPTLVETTLDTNTLDSMPSVASPRRQDSGDYRAAGLPPLPSNTMESSSHRLNPPSRPLVASSVYSERMSYADNQATGRNQDAGHYDSQYAQNYNSRYRDIEYPNADVSPPDSPVNAHTGYGRESPDVSPIDDTPQTPVQLPRQDSRFATAIPVPRKAAAPVKDPRNPNKYPSPPSKNRVTSFSHDPSRNTRWDDFSGEPTTSEKGKPAQTTPGSVPLHESSAPKQSQKAPFSLLAKGKELNQARKKFMESRRQPDKDPAAQLPPPREPWKGLSGRSAMVEPVRAKKKSELRPLDVSPRRDSVPGANRRPLPNRGVQVEHTSVAGSKTDAGVLDKSTIKPIVPLKAGNNSPIAIQSSFPKDPLRSHFPDTTSAREQVHRELTPPYMDSTPTATHSKADEGDIMSRIQGLDLNQQPSSRFSMTTYATTEAGSPPGTPRPGSVDRDAPPTPTVPTEIKYPPVRSTKRKPTPSELSMSTLKTLPQCPPEMQAKDRIDAMQARLGDLSRRQMNINTILHELTQVVQPSSIAYDMATRSEVKKTVESLNLELADIKKEEHDLGLKLLRALKKRDEGDSFSEPSGLWIKRVTS
ncbi:hypothetical protein AJ80_02632 [Polytolypa hystricis UAMH7299]|uniref:Uncharacterized protein n=1 Tax=Polytolypa hystricis (strain UAMH7299) TaxID=1447883 RepID=A0A2B7YQS8_POLH7|nr:hypothetical protein AJ80_02632 [Polytolypa hystricis UAMH7299]